MGDCRGNFQHSEIRKEPLRETEKEQTMEREENQWGVLEAKRRRGTGGPQCQEAAGKTRCRLSADLCVWHHRSQ